MTRDENPAHSDEGKRFADCPCCGGTTRTWRNHLTDDEYTQVIACPSCDFEIETMSNKAAAMRRRRERVDFSTGGRE